MRDSPTILLDTILSRTQCCRDYPQSFIAMDDGALWLEGMSQEKCLTTASDL